MVVAIVGFASLIPQVESPTPEVLEISDDLSSPELAALGELVFQSPEAGCLACHALGRVYADRTWLILAARQLS